MPLIPTFIRRHVMPELPGWGLREAADLSTTAAKLPKKYFEICAVIAHTPHPQVLLVAPLRAHAPSPNVYQVRAWSVLLGQRSRKAADLVAFACKKKSEKVSLHVPPSYSQSASPASPETAARQQYNKCAKHIERIERIKCAALVSERG